MDKLAALHGGTFTAIYQFQGGGNTSHLQVGDAQNFSFATDADNRSQLGQLWYLQKFLDDTSRLRLGKLEGSADFDVSDNVREFMNNSYQTSPTLRLLPSFPETGMGIQLFYEPTSNLYAGAGVFDGSLAHGVRLGEYGVADFRTAADNLFLIGEMGQRYKLDVHAAIAAIHQMIKTSPAAGIERAPRGISAALPNRPGPRSSAVSTSVPLRMFLNLLIRLC
jgi:carbohydrate-selective porin OprB